MERTIVDVGNETSKEMEGVDKKESSEKFLQAVKIGIVKQLYKDNLITANQYQFLLIKYGVAADFVPTI